MARGKDFALCATFGLVDAIKEGDYRFTHLAGRCRSGADQTGHVVHVLVSGRALCGREPGARSAGWSTYNDQEITCPKCNKQFEHLS